MGGSKRHLTFSNVVSLISLTLALGLGGAWAATELSKNEVKSKHIGKGAVKGSDIATNAVSSPKVADGTLTGEDVDEGALGKVPSAANADAAAQAMSADSAQTATTAASADSAQNADLLDNLDSSSFASAGRFRFGTADHSSATPIALFSAGGISVTTDGDTDTDSTVRIQNSSGSVWDVSNSSNTTVAGIGSGGATAFPYTGRAGVVVMRDIANPAKAIMLVCGNDIAPNILDCWGFLSPSV